jgi:flagellum-specific ATP synthase
LVRVWGTLSEIGPAMVRVRGISHHAAVGDTVVFAETCDARDGSGAPQGEVLTVAREEVLVVLHSLSSRLKLGARAWLSPQRGVAIGDHWLGRVVDPSGRVMGDPPAASASVMRPLRGSAPEAHLRRGLGDRIATGFMVTDTLLPLCRGQRIGLFAGSGVGKSTLLAGLADRVEADRVVIALIGERSREVNDFAQRALSPETRARSVVVAATSSEPPAAKARAALCAIAAAEHFRDQGHHVLFLFDSVTRLAEAHRETALMAGETPALNAFPPSTARVIAELAERTGPGTATQGDITAVFSVLVAGSDLEEPVADMLRGILDGHVVLSRAIAERGRFPAIDVLRSVSRSLPGAASAIENAQLETFRRLLALYEEVLPMVRAGLYVPGSDPETDRAIALFPALDAMIAQRHEGGVTDAFAHLSALLSAEAAQEQIAARPGT